ncbi:MAG: VCBS repeat-containing protein [Bryobacteraceae bacterium]
MEAPAGQCEFANLKVLSVSSVSMPARLYLFLSAAALAGVMSALAGTAAPPPLPHVAGPYAGVSWVIADFDGDGRPDVLTSSVNGLDAAGYNHQIDLRAGSGGAQSSSFQVTGASRGLNLFARDVDGDHDLDLVITNGLSNAPVGVWINDGQGVFTQGDIAAYPSSIWRTLESNFLIAPSAFRDLCILRERRSSAAPPAAAYRRVLPPAHRTRGSGGYMWQAAPLSSPASSRAPPLL